MAYPQWSLPQVPLQEAGLSHTTPYGYAAQMPMTPLPSYAAGLEAGYGPHTMHPDILPPDDDDNCLYVNPKQYERIVKRRAARLRFEHRTGVPWLQRTPQLKKSAVARNRSRGSSGVFFKKGGQPQHVTHETGGGGGGGRGQSQPEAVHQPLVYETTRQQGSAAAVAAAAAAAAADGGPGGIATAAGFEGGGGTNYTGTASLTDLVHNRRGLSAAPIGIARDDRGGLIQVDEALDPVGGGNAAAHGGSQTIAAAPSHMTALMQLAAFDD